ncbi:hypothetical protein BV25DRAFT_1827564 [Artomyces pyxidatus]|uniref:Uncharacterized protein n=1 Tax=Artomyces pyxidatus TaxID=48021 RepID=A0ACB8SWY0_9AGAM|nr:hypothetical protein BV25DRAFT_1827564 [Artomyces pyxidatus]
MPSLSGAAQVVRASGDKVVLIVGQGAQMGALTPQIADYGKISSRSGNVTIGFSGEDDVSASKPQGLVQEMLQRIVR